MNSIYNTSSWTNASSVNELFDHDNSDVQNSAHSKSNGTFQTHEGSGIILTEARQVVNGTSKEVESRYPPRLMQVFAALRKECQDKMQTDLAFKSDEPYCGRNVDMWGGCWPDTPAGSMAVINCPAIPAFDTNKHAYRQCTENGTWFNNRTAGIRRVDYSECLLKDKDIVDDTKYIYIFIGGFSLSLVMLIISLAIFFRFKQLRCERITIHKNLFISYVLTGTAWILYYILVALDGDVLLHNPVWCRILHVLCQYFTVCNFLWMFCEGLYINTIMVYAFSSGKKLILSCYVIGWGVPLLLTGIYAGIRNNTFHQTVDCWIGESDLQWIMFGPVVFSIVVNAIFLINIVRLLVTKLRQMPEADQTKKATRATLILVPLLGLQYLLLPIRPPPDSKLEEIYHILVAILISSQGAFVSLMYCFLNGEVISVMRRKYKQHRLMTTKRSSLRSSSCPAQGNTVSDMDVPLQHNGNCFQDEKCDISEKTPLGKDSV
ncbi:calcitonin receptor-like isoform X2 [Mercenaria mercenaria]|uniref:calcitonin receptor-like isoform X2 n=1 Tax=Mercenaria mercenaria TaxID=6596 RepID=UPI00234F91C5|nr:calcitonin receptor-like isoform X2 [Mercenaria mercenaria]XP_045169202.2 calcitonin receptor-like isoform X2 [Mercenaria mercenaria]XP_045169203.2 calcitonin receptor-like isoform X2 [Mercenaria mercenaria]XP_045169204.2 calcitonin receptor-like isoform X2 [Mercenaria mercenaria]